MLHWAPMIDGNPYQKLLDEALRRHGADTVPRQTLDVSGLLWPRTYSIPQVIHLHWVEHLLRRRAPRGLGRPLMVLRAIQVLSVLIVARLRGIRTVWTLHDVSPHMVIFPTLERPVFKAVGHMADSVIVHSHCAARAARDAYGPSNFAVIYHGNYIGAYPTSTRTPTETREALGVPRDAVMLLAFGLIKPYKQIPDLIRAVKASTRKDLHLVVVGSCTNTSLRDEAVSAARGDGRIHLDFHFVDDGSVAELHEAADAAILHYKHAYFSSGALMLALSFGLPVIAPANSTATEIAGPPIVQAYSDNDIEAALAKAQRVSDATRAEVRALASSYGWDTMAEGVLGSGDRTRTNAAA